MKRLLLVNPNTSIAVTVAMLAIAREAAPAGTVLEGVTARFGVPLITDEAELAEAASAAVAAALEADGEPDGVIVAAFGDPGLEELRTRLPCPVTGIAEAGMAEAAAGGRRFAIATTTPGLAAAIRGRVDLYGHAGRLTGLYLTAGDPIALTADPDALAEALFQACRAAVRDGAEAVVIGGGPLAVAARALGSRLPVPIVEPVPAAIRLAGLRASSRVSSARNRAR